MLTIIPALFNPAELAAIRRDLETAPWADGRSTAGRQGAAVKANQQLTDETTLGRNWGNRLLDMLGRSGPFVAAALPHRIVPPMFNRYSDGGHFGTHIDNAIRVLGSVKVRTDLAATLFLSEPSSYDGGELVVETRFGTQRVKLAAGDMVLYPASSQHRVEPVTRGVRLAAVLWVQSMIRDDSARSTLLTLDQAVQSLGQDLGLDDPRVVALTSVYHNLIREWAET